MREVWLEILQGTPVYARVLIISILGTIMILLTVALFII